MKWVALRAEGGTTNNIILDSIALESLFSSEAREKEIKGSRVLAEQRILLNCV